MARLEFTCECDTPERHPYSVTDHSGAVVICEYCDDCAYLAACDWNGNTARIVPSFGASRPEYREGSEADRTMDEVAYAYRDLATTCYAIASDRDGPADGNDRWAVDGCAAMLLALHVERTGRALPFGRARAVVAMGSRADVRCAS